LERAISFPSSSLSDERERKCASFLQGYAGYMMAHQWEVEGERERARKVWKEVQKKMAGRKERLPDGSTSEDFRSAQGRFLNSDPLKGRINWYIYNDPVNKIDPEGTHMFDISSEPLYCKAAGNDPRADGMKQANRCFCEVSKLARELINNLSPRAKLCNFLSLFGQCKKWLECMDQCIFQDWAQWWVGRQIGHILKLTKTIRPPGSPQPDEC